MFVLESNNPYENNVIRPMKQATITSGYYHPTRLASHKSVFIAL